MLNRSIASLVLAALCVFHCGCKPEEQISTYTIARTSPPRQPLDPDEVAAQLNHTIAAIVPQGKKAWFFKLVGSAAAADRQREQIKTFLSSVSLDPEAKQPPTWQLPDGWEEQPATELRLATIVIPDKDGPLQLAVSALPLSGNWDEYLVSNVNRWLGQLKQGPLPAATVKKLAQEVPVKGATATLFELVGIMQKAPGMNPHAGMTRPGQRTAEDQQLPAADPGDNAYLDFTTPKGWLPGRSGGMRKAAFRISGDGTEGELTVIDLPTSAGDQVKSVPANMKRWAGQVGLTDLDDEAISKLVQQVTVDGVEGSYAELIGPENSTRHDAMLVAMVEQKDKVWFIKLSGPSAVVTAQKEAFREFLDSIRFK